MMFWYGGTWAWPGCGADRRIGGLWVTDESPGEHGGLALRIGGGGAAR